MVGRITIKLDKEKLNQALGLKEIRYFGLSLKNIVIDNDITGLNITFPRHFAGPNILYDENSKKYKIYFMADTLGDFTSEMFMMETEDFESFTTAQKVLSPDGDEESVETPSVIFENGKYYMFYHRRVTGDIHNIGVAESDDGINFTKYGGNPILTDPEGTTWLGRPSVIKWKDGKYYLYAYNGNMKLLIFRATSFPYEWEHVKTLESSRIGYFSPEAFYDSELDKILLIINYEYPKPTSFVENDYAMRLGLWVADEPLGAYRFYGTIMEIPIYGKGFIYDKMCKNIFGHALAKYNDKYILMFNAEANDSTEHGFVGVLGEKPLRFSFEIHETITDDPFIKTLLKPGIGVKVRLKHANIYAFRGTPSAMYIVSRYNETEYGPPVRTDTSTLYSGKIDVEMNGDEIVLEVKGASAGEIEIAGQVEFEIEPLISSLVG